MTVIKCDRCGAIFKKVPMSLSEEIKGVVENFISPAEKLRRIEQIEVITDRLDLCPDCTESLKKWLETGTEKEIK